MQTNSQSEYISSSSNTHLAGKVARWSIILIFDRKKIQNISFSIYYWNKQNRQGLLNAGHSVWI